MKGKTVFSAGINQKLDAFVVDILNPNNQANIPIQYNRLNKLHQSFSKMTMGNLVYRNLKKNSNCINCGQCAKSCPASNLIMQEGKLVIKNSNGCMRCLRCVQICSKKAINFTGLKRKGSYTREITEGAYNRAVI